MKLPSIRYLRIRLTAEHHKALIAQHSKKELHLDEVYISYSSISDLILTELQLLLYNALELAGESGQNRLDRWKNGVKFSTDDSHQLTESQHHLHRDLLFLHQTGKSRHKLMRIPEHSIPVRQSRKNTPHD